MRDETREEIQNYLNTSAAIVQRHLKRLWRVKGDVSITFYPKKDGELKGESQHE